MGRWDKDEEEEEAPAPQPPPPKRPRSEPAEQQQPPSRPVGGDATVLAFAEIDAFARRRAEAAAEEEQPVHGPARRPPKPPHALGLSPSRSDSPEPEPEPQQQQMPQPAEAPEEAEAMAGPAPANEADAEAAAARRRSEEAAVAAYNAAARDEEELHRPVDMLQACRSVELYEKLNHIDEGTYGVVYRARERATGRVVALKKVKMEKEKEGFPLTSVREITLLLGLRHPSVVTVLEVVVGRSLDSIFMVMEFMEHDLKGLLEAQRAPLTASEVKCYLRQLLSGVAYLHDHYVLHRDLKTSNVLVSNRGALKLCDFGMARQYGSPLRPYTNMVVTLWYRPPELLLGVDRYSTAVDCWSLGCVFAELVTRTPLLPGRSEIEQLDKIFRLVGTPDEASWPGWGRLPLAGKMRFATTPPGGLRARFPPRPRDGTAPLSDAGFDLLQGLLTCCPAQRTSAQQALSHPWFDEVPLAKEPALMPTAPSQAAAQGAPQRPAGGGGGHHNHHQHHHQHRPHWA